MRDPAAAPVGDSISILVREGPVMHPSRRTLGNSEVMGKFRGTIDHADFPTA
jgi:hypothetical protein